MKYIRLLSYRKRWIVSNLSLALIQIILFHINLNTVNYWFRRARRYPYEVEDNYLFYVAGTKSEIEFFYKD